MCNDTKSNFYKLIHNKNIIIPIIQRDYVQGKTTSKINGIRESLIRDMLCSLSEEKGKVDFQYIYGIYKEGECFLPIDGQQRLTSIFLFAWGMAIKAGDAKATSELKKFSYQVRESSRDFFRCLLELNESNELKYFEDFDSYMRGKTKKFDEFSWFKGKWQSDQTVRSALVFLDSLRNEFQKNKIDSSKATKYLERILSVDCPFEFYLIVQNEVTDDPNKSKKDKQDEAFEAENRAATTYINMNSRGKSLNEFENFKALLHKCEYKFVEKTGGKEFINNYESNYIHTLAKYIEKNSKVSLSLSEKIEKMDEFTLSLLMHVYNDIYKMKGEEREEQNDVYHFMNFIKENDCECSRIFPDDYFEFVNYVINKANPDNGNSGQEFDDVFFAYCNNHTYKDRWNFMIKYWCPYRLKNSNISVDGWNVLCNHLVITCDDGNKGVAYRWCQNSKCDNRYVLNAVLDELCGAKVGTVEEFLKGLDVEKFLEKVCGNDSGNRNLKLTFARITEEKIKATIYLTQNKEAECAELLNVDSQIRYLLYLAQYYNENGKYDALKEYITQHKKINQEISQPSIEWRKVYYMTGLDLNVFSPEPMKETEQQCWRNETRYWEGKDIPRKELNRVKSIFDILIKNETTISALINDYQNKYKDISNWLYYLLRRDMVEVINGLVTQTNNGYKFDNRNYYDYVLEKDLSAKGYKIVNKCMGNLEIYRNTISPRPGRDEQTRNRNPIFTIASYYEDVFNNTMINNNIWYQFEFKDYDCNNSNEDQFYLWEDRVFASAIGRDRASVESSVSTEIMNLTVDELCDLIYQKKTDVFLNKLKGLNLPQGWTIVSVMNEGVNGVKVNIKCSNKPFQGVQPIIKNHSQI